ncbi:MAG: ABC transporter permease [Planctomycetota bacterium]
MRGSVVIAVARATMRDFWRTPESVFWSYAFPLGMALVLGFAFRGQPRAPVPVAVVPAASAEIDEVVLGALRQDERLQVATMDEVAAERALALGRATVVVRLLAAGPRLELDPTRPDAELAELVVRRCLQEGAGRRDPIAIDVDEVERPGARYIDFLVPGLIGLNLLGMGMFGVGFNLVYMRVRKTLRRLAVTPMGRADFFAGFMLTRLLLALPASVVVVVFGRLVFGVPVHGSWLALVALIVVGAVAFSGIGLLLGSRAKTIEGASGLMNIVQMPMWLIGGVFFSNQRFPGFVQTMVDAVPMSLLTDGLRGVMLEGKGVIDVWVPIVALFALGGVCLAAAVRIFRWN